MVKSGLKEFQVSLWELGGRVGAGEHYKTEAPTLDTHLLITIMIDYDSLILWSNDLLFFHF